MLKINLVEYMKAQIEEIEKYIWCKGIELRHNPLEDKPKDDWASEWLEKFAANFAEINRNKFLIKA